MSYVFISFGPADRGYVAQLAEHLRAAGIPVWLDEQSELPGRWEQAGRRQLDGCAAFVVVMSPDSFLSPSVTREVEYALALGKPMFPLLLVGHTFPALAAFSGTDVSDGRMPPWEQVARLRGLTGATPPPSSPFPSPSSPVPPTTLFPPGPGHPPAPAPPVYPPGLGYPAAAGSGSAPYLPGSAAVWGPGTGSTGYSSYPPSGPIPPGGTTTGRGPGFWVLIAVGAAALLLVLGCGVFLVGRFVSGVGRTTPIAASTSGPGQPSNPPAPPVSPGTTLQIGVDLPLQGTLARSSQETFTAMDLYLKQIGRRVGPYPIELVKYDDSTAAKGTWDEATCTANAAKHLANTKEVAIVGTANSGCTKLEVRALNTQATPSQPTMLMVSHANTNPGLTIPYELGEPNSYYPHEIRNFARVITTDNMQGRADAAFAASIGATRCLVLDDGGTYGKTIEAAFSGEGMTVIDSHHWEKESSSYPALFTRAQAVGANCVFLAGDYLNNGAQLIKDKVAVLGPNTGAVKLIAVEGFAGYPELDRLPAADGMYVTYPGVPLSGLTRNPVAQSFVKEYTTTTGTAPVSAYALYGVQALQVILAAIEKSTGTRESIRSAVFSAPGITIGADKAMLGAAISINPLTGDCSLKQVTVDVIKNGAETFYTSVTAPSV